MMEEKMQKFNRLLMSTNRKGMNDLINFLTVNNFYKSPCSSRFHLCCEGGLLLHSLSTYEIANKIHQALELDIPFDSVIIGSLLHDCGKQGAFNKPMYVPKVLKNGTISTAEPFTRNTEIQKVEHELLSLHIVSQFITLTEDEYWSIMHHNGLYGVFRNNIPGNESALYLLLHTADMLTSRLYETKEGLI